MATPTAPAFRGSPPTGAFVGSPRSIESAGAQLNGNISNGLVRLTSTGAGGYLEHGTAYVPPPAVQTASYTAAAAGGAPGAQFGPPGVGSAPVMLGGFSISPVVALALLAGAGYVVWRFTR